MERFGRRYVWRVGEGEYLMDTGGGTQFGEVCTGVGTRGMSGASVTGNISQVNMTPEAEKREAFTI